MHLHIFTIHMDVRKLCKNYNCSGYLFKHDVYVYLTLYVFL